MTAEDVRKLVEVVQLELSNLCPHSHMHPRCPLSVVGPPANPPKYLHTDAILAIMDVLGRWDYFGSVIFSAYNEPMVDPRLFMLLDELKRRAPKAKPYMWTSSFWINDYMLSQLAEHNIAWVGMNRYTDDEQNRAVHVPAGLKFLLRNGHHDNRLDIYDHAPDRIGYTNCGAPYRALMVHHTGEVGLCCLDWKRTVVFGNVYEKGIEEIINGPVMQELYDRAVTKGPAV